VELFIVVCCIMPTLNLRQNPFVLYYLSLSSVNFWSLFVKVLCTLWQYVLLCHTWNILVVSSPFLVVGNLLPCVQICYSCNTWLYILVYYSIVILFLLVCLFLHRLFLNLSSSYSRYWSTHILVQLLWLPFSIVLMSWLGKTAKSLFIFLFFSYWT